MVSKEQLYTLIHALPFAAHIRNIDTGKYIIANKAHAENYGFTEASIITDFSYDDKYHYRRNKLESLKGSLILEDEHKAFIDLANMQADTSKQPLHFKICTLFPTGFIYAANLKKIPLFDYQDKINAVLTFSEDITHSLDLLGLYHLYKKHYPIQQAIRQFLNYIKIAHYFHKLPTNQEVTTLLMLRYSTTSKYVARKLDISYRTVEEYKARLRNKLKVINLDGLLLLLRMHFEKSVRTSDNQRSNIKLSETNL